jgi:hypothetical protein
MRLVENKRDLHSNAVFDNLALLDFSLQGEHLETGDTSQGLSGAIHTLIDRLFKALGRCRGDLGDAGDSHKIPPLFRVVTYTRPASERKVQSGLQCWVLPLESEVGWKTPETLHAQTIKHRWINLRLAELARIIRDFAG